MDSSLKDLNRTFSSIQNDWPEVLTQSCNPLEIALKLLDESSVGEAHKYTTFIQQKKQFSNTLKKAVNKHYMAFNDSIGSYGIAVENLSESQSILGDIKKNLQDVDSFATHRATFLVELSKKQRQYTKTIEVLDNISKVKKSISKIDTSISNRDFDTAEQLILECSTLADQYGIFQLPALSDTFQDLRMQQQRLFDCLVDQISDLIYLKGHDNLTSSNLALFSLASADIQDVSHAIVRPLTDFLAELSADDKKQTGNELDDKNSPQSNLKIFSGLQKSFELLARIKKVPDALSVLVNRWGTEIRRIIRSTNEEVHEKYPSQFQFSSKSSGNGNGADSIFGASDILDPNFPTFQSVNSPIVSEFFTKLLYKFVRVLQHQRAVCALAEKYECSYDSLAVWNELQKQFESVLYRYIVDEKLFEKLDKQRGYGRDSSNPFLKPSIDPNGDDGAPIVQFARFSISNSSLEVKSMEQLHSVLKEMFPEKYTGESDSIDQGSLFIDDDSDGFFRSKDNLLVPANIFNMGSIVDSFLLFVVCSSLILPSESKSLPTTFFERFMNYVFRAQLESILLYQVERHWKQKSGDPVAIKKFFFSLMSILDTSLYCREPYVSVVLKALEKVVSLYQAQINETIPPEFLRKVKTRLIAKWLGDSELVKSSSNLMEANSETDIETFGIEELKLTMKERDNFTSLIMEHDFLDAGHLKSLVSILYGILETMSWLPECRRDVGDADDDSGSDSLKQQWYILGNSSVGGAVNGRDFELSLAHPYIALKGKLINRFDTILDGFNGMALRIKLLIKYDSRIKAIWYVNRMLKQDFWAPETQSEEIEPNVLDLNHFITELNSILQSMIPDTDRCQIFSMLPLLLDYLLVYESRSTPEFNSNGVHKMLINIRVLQQALRNVIAPKDVNFSRCNNYFELVDYGKDEIVEAITKYHASLNFSTEDYKNLVRLAYSQSGDKKSYIQAVSKVRKIIK